MRELRGRRVLVVGVGKSGLAAARLLAREGAKLVIADSKSDLGPAAEELRALGAELALGGLDPVRFSQAQLVVTSPGVPLTDPAFAAARKAGVPVIGEVELASGFISEPLLGITGTNGKSTTTALTGFICEQAGLRTFTGGNLGRPLSERALGPTGDIVVCELSSFQLESIETLHPLGSAFLNLTPDHLDRYSTHEAYGQAKRRIFMNQTESDFAVVNAHDRDVMAITEGIRPRRLTFGLSPPVSQGIRDYGEQLTLRLDGPDELYTVMNRALRGRHNRENAMAAVLLARGAGVRKEKVQQGLDGYPGLPHRLEFVRNLDGVEWINDSKATNVDSTLVALRAFTHGVILIAGGRGKGAPYAPLVELAPDRVRAVLTIGEDAPTVEKAFEGVVPIVTCRELATAVKRAKMLATEGDTVLLSPACASYDQFKNFEHRGESFKALVGSMSEAVMILDGQPVAPRKLVASRPLRFDPLMLVAVLGLMSLGLVMVYSASAVSAQSKIGDGFFYLKRQAAAAILGVGTLLFMLKLGYKRLAPLTYPILLTTFALLIAVLIPHVGYSAGGAQRWIRLPGLSLQPAEIAKLALVIYLAFSLAKKRDKVRLFSIGFLPHCFVVGVMVILCLKEPDFGTSVALTFILFAMLFAAGAKISYLVGSILLALPVAYQLVAHSPYRMKRLIAFMDPWAHRHDVGYQVAESLMSVGSGGLWGQGLGESKQKLFFLPEAHTDFIFSIIGEELGFWGVAMVLGLFALLLWRGLRAALNASDPFGAYLALGITMLFGFQSLVNIGVCMGVLPTKGLTLPFVSYGGCSLVVCCAAAGILLSISGSTGGFLRPQGGGAR